MRHCFGGAVSQATHSARRGGLGFVWQISKIPDCSAAGCLPAGNARDAKDWAAMAATAGVARPTKKEESDLGKYTKR